MYMYMYMHDIIYVCHKHTFPTTKITHLLTKRNNTSSFKSLPSLTSFFNTTLQSLCKICTCVYYECEITRVVTH